MGRMLAAAALFSLALPSAAGAAAGDWGRAANAEARLVAAVDAAGSGTTVPLGLEIRLKPGWKTYWRSPGDAGLAPRIDWAGSENLAGAELSWPAPARFSQFGLETFGYEGQVLLPITGRRHDAGRPLALRAGVDLLVCHDICVPAHMDLTLTLPLGPAVPSAEAPLIAGFVRQVPGDGAAAGLKIVSVRTTGPAGAPVLEVTASAAAPFVSPDLFVESTPPLSFSPPQMRFGPDRRTLTARLSAVAPGAAGPPDRVTLTLVDGDRAMEATATPASASTASGPPGVSAVPAPGAAEAAPALPPDAGPGLATALAMALLGGLILNLMPCVLPVLSLKLLAAIGHGGGCVRAVRAGFLASAAGILSSFLLLAGIMIGLKAAGTAVGWGLQFQQPVFLAAMAVVLSLFACNLWQAFEIPLPRFIADAAGRPETPGSLAGPFLTGALATLLATPCSAPFLGTAIGFALARGPADILSVFLVMGLGLALPYLAVAAFPRLATALPRPGRWMIRLRQLFGVALAVTALWLLSLLAGRSLATGVVVGWLILGLGLTLAARLRLPTPFRPAAVAAAAAMGLAAIATPWLLPPATAASPARITAAAPASDAGLWRPFDPEAIRTEVSRGHVVFVDVTADWCLTCQANQRLVLDRPEVADRLHDPSGSVVAMRADWTRPDQSIARYLARFGRYGIPFNAVYGPGAPQGLALPELLSVGAVLDGLGQAAGAPAGPRS